MSCCVRPLRQAFASSGSRRSRAAPRDLTRALLKCAMPFLDVQKKLGISLDRHFVFLSAEQPYKNAARCHAFEKEWIECASGIGATRAKKECKIEFDDFEECFLRFKTIRRMREIKLQREKLMKEGKYTPPPHHSGKEEPRP